MSKLLILNWKMNPETLKQALVLAKASDYENVVVAPPFPFIEEVEKVLSSGGGSASGGKKAELGAQDLFWAEKGAFTGEVSAKELKSIGVNYVIIGHSERRHKLGETDEIIAKKMKVAVDAGLIPILCVGETKEEKDNGEKENVIKRQVEKGLSLITKSSLAGQAKLKAQSLFVAYEPVWAIGTGDPETPAGAVEIIKFIKRQVSGIKCQVLYGGSVDSKNLGDYLKYKEIDGALVGGASLKTKEIEKMIKIVNSN